MADRGEAALENVVANGSEIVLAHFELAGTGGDKFGGGEGLSEVGDEKRSHGDVEREERLDAVGHVERRVAGGFADGCAVCPKDVGRASWPLGDVAFASLDEGVANRPVLPLDDAIGAGVVGGNANVSDAIPVRKSVQRGDVGGAVVGNDLFDCAPSAQYLLEKKCSDRAASFCAERTPFRPSGERAAGLSDVLEAVSGCPNHSVDVDFVEEGCWDGDGRGNADLGGLTQLALVAGVDGPCDALLERGPPEAA